MSSISSLVPSFVSSSSSSTSSSSGVPVRVIGNHLSPFVRKVFVCLNLCQIPYQVDPLVPFFGNDNFSALSPLRRIPVLQLPNGTNLLDSSVICQYIYDTSTNSPKCRLWYGSNATEAAQLRWLEEFADTRMAEVALWQLYFERVVAPGVFRRPTNEQRCEKVLTQDLPTILNYLESPKSCFLSLQPPANMLSIADIAVGAVLRNAELAGWKIDEHKWPGLAKRLQEISTHEAFASLRNLEDILQKKSPLKYPKALKDAGAPVVESSQLWSDKPRPGNMAKL